MKHFVWLLFLPGFLCNLNPRNRNPLTIHPDSLVTWKGSCVLIPCEISRYNGAVLNPISLLWYFQPFYDRNQSEFNGFLLYNSSMASGYPKIQSTSVTQGQVQFVGDLRQHDKKNCSLKISNVQIEDNGIYGARLFASYSRPAQQNKWFLNATVHVAESPPAPIMDVSPTYIRESLVRVTCSVTYHCLDDPLRLVIGLEKNHLPSQRMTIINGVIKTVVSFRVTWEDHRKNLFCSLERQDRSEISKSTKQLDVNYAPKGVQLKASPGTKIQEGVKLSLECTIMSSNPNVSEYYWYKDDLPMDGWQNRNKIEFITKGDQDSGTYKCGAKNSVETEMSKEVRIDVLYPPKKVQVNGLPPQGNIKEGVRMDLRCSSNGNPPITQYEWYKDQDADVFRTGQQLQFDSLELRNAGTYYCVANNSLGHLRSSSVTLDVLYAPKDVRLAIENPQLPIKEEDTVRLNCSFSHSNPSTGIQYKWYKDNSFKSKKGNLWLFAAKLKDAGGDYRCEACNTVKCISSPSVTVDIYFAPKEVKVIQNPGTQIYEGKHVLLGCEVVKANPAVSSYRWYKDGELQKSDPTSADLTFFAVTPAHSGRYWCEATNSVATSRSQEIMLNVYYGPRNVLLSLERQATVTEGMDVTLLCAADANPPPTYFELYRDDEKKLEKPDRILILRKVEIEDSGDYHCIAYNKVSGAESQTFTLSVSYSRTTKLKHGLKGLGAILSFIIILGMLIFALKTWKKRSSSGTPRTERSGSFFVRKAKPEVPSRNRANEGAVNPSGFLNEGAEEAVSYAMLRFPRGGSEEEDDYSRVTAPRLALDPSKEEVVYSVIKKPGLLSKGDTKHDYENVVAPKEEELHYSSLVNLAPRPRPTCRDSETDSESEDSIQYAALKH